MTGTGFSFQYIMAGDHTFFNQLVRGYGMNWGNTTATFRWNRVWDRSIVGKLQCYF